MQNNTNNTNKSFEIDQIDNYVSSASNRKTFGNYEFVQARIIRGLPGLVMRKRGKGDNETLLFVCTNRERSRWARIGSEIGKCGPIDNFELIDMLENTLCWQELHGMPRLGLNTGTDCNFDVSDAMVRFMHFGGISALQSAKLVSMIMAKDIDGISAFWLAIESDRANVKTEATEPAAG